MTIIACTMFLSLRPWSLGNEMRAPAEMVCGDKRSEGARLDLDSVSPRPFPNVGDSLINSSTKKSISSADRVPPMADRVSPMTELLQPDVLPVLSDAPSLYFNKQGIAYPSFIAPPRAKYDQCKKIAVSHRDPDRNALIDIPLPISSIRSCRLTS
jgi:hypothetical protein